MEAVELDPLAADAIHTASRQRSLEEARPFADNACDVYIWDEATGITANTKNAPKSEDSHYVIRGTRPARPRTGNYSRQTPNNTTNIENLPDDLRRRLDARDVGKSRWINVVGWSEDLANYLSRLYLADHGCLDFNGPAEAGFGGPMPNKSGQEFVWLQTKIWFMGSQSPNWSSIEEVDMRIVVVQPSEDKAGTVITNFPGPLKLARRMSRICTKALIEDHPFGGRTLCCGWIVAYAILRTVVEQVDCAFQIFDPVSSENLFVPRVDDLPFVLDKATNLARLNRYLSELEEFASFFEAVQEMSQAERAAASNQGGPQKPLPSCYRLIHRATLERSRLRHKILLSKQLSSTYLKQYENLIQTGITYATTRITERLDSGRAAAERFATIGIFLGGFSSLLSPLALLTGYFGMNVEEFVGQEGGLLTLYEFWKWGMPLIVVATVGMGYLGLRLMIGKGR